MTAKIKKPLVNKDTFEFNVVAQAQQLGSRPAARKNDTAFSLAEYATVQDLQRRVLSLSETFKIGARVLDPKARPADLNLEHNWVFYQRDNLSHLSQEYTAQSSYYVRAYRELVGIAVATADAFLGLMEAPVSLDHSPNMQVHGSDGKGRSVTWIAQVKTTAEAYHHARMEFMARDFLNSLSSGQSDINDARLLSDVHSTIVAATNLMSAAVSLSGIYSDKKWVICKD